MHKLSIMAGLCLLSILSLNGCATLENFFTKNNTAIQAATGLAVGEAILGQKTPAAESALAKQIISIAQKVSADATSSTTAAVLVQVAQAEIAKLGNPQEVLAGNTLLTALQPLINQYIGTGVLNAAAVVDIQQFCTWVVAAATPYV